jgi:hypothetical protein
VNCFSRCWSTSPIRYEESATLRCCYLVFLVPFEGPRWQCSKSRIWKRLRTVFVFTFAARKRTKKAKARSFRLFEVEQRAR